MKIKTSEHLSQLQDTDLAQLETFDYFVKIYEVRMELYGKFLNVVSLAFLITSTILGIGFLAYSTLFANFICM